MELYEIPFEDQLIIYRPLSHLAFIGNRAMLRYIEERVAGETEPHPEIERFLEAVDFWQDDPPPPEPWKPERPHRPTTGVLLLTSACNLRCIYCYARGGDDPSVSMPLKLAVEAVDAIHRNALSQDAKHFNLAFHGGGEPTMHHEVMEAAVECARGKDLPCTIAMSTNGVWSDRTHDFVLDHFDNLSLSFDGVAEVQNRQRPLADGGASFDAVMETIRALDDGAVDYGVRMTVTPETAELLPAGIEMLCSETECPGFQVEPCFTNSRGDYISPSPGQARDFIESFLMALDLADEAGRSLFYSGARPSLVSASFCQAIETALVITPEGDVVMCFETYDRRHPLTARFTFGALRDGSLVIDDEALARLVHEQQQRRAECRECFCYWHCAGDCASRRFFAGGNDSARCTMNQSISRALIARYIAHGEGVWRGEVPEGQPECRCKPSDA